MSVQIVIDSAADFTPQEAEREGLVFLPLTTRIDGVEYRDGLTITHEEFYEKLRECKQLPTTSQLTPFDFEQAFRAAAECGDEVVAITLSSKLSGTAQSAMIAAAGFPECVWVVDSQNATIGERILVEYAVRLRDEGLSAPAIAEALDQAKNRICLLGLVETLDNLVKGGRLSKTAALVGAILNIKPVLTIKDGAITVLGKARGYKQSGNLLNETIRKRGGIDFSMPYMLAYAQDDSLLKSYVESSRAVWETEAAELPVCTIGSTIGTHTGPGLIAVAFFELGESREKV